MASLCVSLHIPHLREFSYRSLQVATNFFSDHYRIACCDSANKPDCFCCDYAQIYRGAFPNGTLIAVSSYNPDRIRNYKRFDSYMRTLSRIQHPNIVRLIGYCENKSHYFVHEYTSNGSLYDLLSDKEKRETVFNWPMRVAVCNGIARGLYYLHEETNPCVTHLDIKPSNVLLDSNFSPKITGIDDVKFVFGLRKDFGTNIWPDVYQAPEYLMAGRYSPKCDVYSFGLVMLQIISGRNVIMDFVSWALDLLREDRVLEIVDPVLADCPIDQVLGFMDVAFSCLEMYSDLRPTMGEVIQMLDRVCYSPLTPLELQQPGTPYLSADELSRQTNQRNEISSEFGVAQRYDYRSLQVATTFFSNYNRIGRDAYRGALPNGTLIAVRKYDPKTEMQELFPYFVKIFSIRHPNIDRVIGYCFHENYCLTVSEHMSNGSLNDLLIDKEKREFVFNWPMRVAVCKGIARGIHHLHQLTNHWIIHLDIKPSNVLLDSTFSPKIIGFDVAKFVDDEEEKDEVMRMIGYLDPEYLRTVICTRTSDAYSFGVVMLQIITGRTALSCEIGGERIHLTQLALNLLAKDRVLEVVDPVLAEFPVDQVLGFINVALSCVKDASSLRPSMGEVIQMLNRVYDSPLTPLELQQPDTPYLSAASSFRSSVDFPSFVEGESSAEFTGIEQDTEITVSSSGNLVHRQSQTTMVVESPSAVRGEYAAYARKKNMMPRNKA